ncbi:oxidoreductase short chain dehydrogenase/reductase family protein [Coprobacillus sp. CAG:698]|nr:oxidoreductase short chain dehydrogenase/reductase family protein [Coprobacillus sp. CAG:698]
MEFLNKVIVVTGASSGMGREISLQFAKEGAKVIAVARREERLNEIRDLAKSEGYKGEIIPYVGDLSKEETNEKIIEFTFEKYNTLDILVNNAGVLDNFAPVGEVTDECINKVVAVDMMAPFYSTRKAVNMFMEHNIKGNIINIASIAGLCGGKAGTAYTMAKHAVVGLTKNTGFIYRENGIRCNCVCPGGIHTEMTEPSAFANASQRGLANAMLATAFKIPSGYVTDVASLVLFLASEKSSYISGQAIALDGALTSY